MRTRLRAATAALLVAVLACIAASEPGQGITMRIRQEVTQGTLKTAMDYQGRFLDGGRFRVEGSMFCTQSKPAEPNLIISGDGRAVRQLDLRPEGNSASLLDLERVRRTIPDYDPSLTYDPRVYRKLVAEGKAVKVAEATMDGVKVEQYEADLPQGRLSLPANVSLGLPDPAKVRIWICPDDGIARRVELDDAAGATFLKMSFDDVRSGVPMQDADFALTFPADVPTRDITDMMIGLVSASRRAPAQR